MWKEYSAGYIKNNRASGVSVMVAAFISALLLSLPGGLFYNAWKYETERIELEEGGWQGRIVGELNEEDLETIKNYAGVKAAEINRKETDRLNSPNIAVDIYFDDMRTVLEDMAKRLVFPFFVLVTVMASFSLIVIIHNSFAVSMNTRIRQFGIFSSIGATPKQIRACLLQEEAVLCAVPVIVGNLMGIVACGGMIQLVNILLGSEVTGRHKAVFGYHPLVLALTFFITVITIWISAWLPAGKLSRLTPLEAIKNTGELQLKRRKKTSVSAFLFGVEGELAGNALKAQRKALRTASLSLIFSFMAFTLMQCFFTISGISTRETYFNKYQSAWDIMLTVKNAEVDSFEETEEIQGLAGVRSVIAYQKAKAKRIVTESEMSEEMKAFGGFDHASGNYVTRTDEGFLVNVPVIILDDASFLSYCEQIGITPQLGEAVIRNQIRDVTNPDFRHPQFMPYVKGEIDRSILMQEGNEDRTAKIPVLSCTGEVPVLREEYGTLDHYELVHFVSASLWREIKGRIGGVEEDIYVRVLAGENATLEELNELQEEMERLISKTYTVKSENRIQEQEANDNQITGEIRKMFCIEALVISGRPILFTLPPAAVAVGYLLRTSYLEAEVFLAEAPLFPIIIFMTAILGSVAPAYYLGWRNLRKISLAEVLRDDTMM